MMEKDIAKATVHFIAGKGGVGKSLIAKALATYYAGAGYKTLRVELCEEESKEGMRIVPIALESPNLYYLKIFPDHAAYQYLSLKIPQKRILDSLLSKKLFRALCQALPGLSDLTRLGKIWYHADPTVSDEREVFQKIIVDMPSSGFVRRFLSVARVVSQAVKVGPLAKEAALIDQYFSNAKNAFLHIVAVPEELIVKESIEFINDMNESGTVHVGYLFINRFADIYKALLKEPSSDSAPAFMAFMRARAKAHEKTLEELHTLAMPELLVKEQWGEVHESQVISELELELRRCS